MSSGYEPGRDQGCNWERLVMEIEDPKSADVQPKRPIAIASPSDNDVILGRGKRNQQHVGNIWFQQKIDETLPEYNEKERGRKREIVESAVAALRSERNGRFLQMIPWGGWEEANEEVVIAKVAQAFRHRRRALAKSVPTKRRRGDSKADNTIDSCVVSDKCVPNVGFGDNVRAPGNLRCDLKMDSAVKRPARSSSSAIKPAPSNRKVGQYSDRIESERHAHAKMSGKEQHSSVEDQQYAGRLKYWSVATAEKPSDSDGAIFNLKGQSDGNRYDDIVNAEGEECDEFDAFDDISVSSNGPRLLSDTEILGALGKRS